MKLHTKAIIAISFASSIHAFAPVQTATTPRCKATTPTALNIVVDDDTNVLDKVKQVFIGAPKPEAAFNKIVQKRFPGAMNNKDLLSGVVEALADKGYSGANTLLATSLCCDELARQLEDDFNKVYGTNFNLGGLAGFPFAGITGFGAMSAHIPDDGYCLIVYGPHVGITADGTVGKVERKGIRLVDSCCGSALAANEYVRQVTDGEAEITTRLQQFSDRQQDAVRKMILPHGKRLSEANDRMVELPFTLFESQDMLMSEIVNRSEGALEGKRGLALLGGIQINTGPDTLDYFQPLRFDYLDFSANGDGDSISDLLPAILPKKKREVLKRIKSKLFKK